MDCIRAPSIRVCSRGVIADLRGSAGRPLVPYDSEDEAEVTSTLPQQQQHQKTRFSVEDDLNWTSKYLNIDRGSGTSGTRRSGGGGVSPVRAPSPAATGEKRFRRLKCNRNTIISALKINSLIIENKRTIDGVYSLRLVSDLLNKNTFG